MKFFRITRSIRVAARFLSCVCLILLVTRCAQEEKAEFQRYDGPQEEIFDVGVQYSERGKRIVQMTTPSQLRFLNGNKVFPDSINVVFYDSLGRTTTTIRSDSGRFDNAKNIYTVIGNVIVRNLDNQEYLYTTELNWNPVTKRVYNDKPNRMLQKLKGTVLNGVGLTATQDFSEMSMLKITGIVPFNESDMSMQGPPPPVSGSPAGASAPTPAQATPDITSEAAKEPTP